ncbi:MAG: hypothetical protein QOF48_2503, partial [Verrucomicrobiota bacterium]
MNEGASIFLKTLGRFSLQASVMVLLVLVTQWIFRRWLTPRWRCALWLLVIGRILLPASLPTRVSVFNVVPLATRKNSSPSHPITSAREEQSNQLSATHTETSPVQAVPKTDEKQKGVADIAVVTDAPPTTRRAEAVAATPVPLHQRQIPWPLCLFAFWLAGAVGLAVHIIMASVNVARRFRGLPEVSDPNVLAVLENCRLQIKVRTRLRLVEGADMESPVLLGVFRPRLLLPVNFTRCFTLAELHFVFLHELAHVKRRDILINWVVALLQIAHWFNPILWFGFMRWRADRELACDALALEAAGEGRKREYGRTILRLLEGFTQRVAAPGLVGILEDKRQLQTRIGMIASFAPQKRWSFPAMLLLVALATIGLTDGQTLESKGQTGVSRDPKPVNALTMAADQNDVPRLIIQGKKLQEGGRTNEAEALWRAALELDPRNDIARGYLTKLGRTNLPAAKSSAQFVLPPVSEPIPRINLEARRRINSLLDSI